MTREINRILSRLDAMEEDLTKALNELADPIGDGWKPKKWLKSKSANNAIRKLYLLQTRIWIEKRHQENQLNKQKESEVLID